MPAPVLAGLRPAIARNVGIDSVVIQGRIAYHGGVLQAAGGGAATVTVYDGSSTSDQFRDVFAAAASDVVSRWYERGVEFVRGIYVDLGPNVSNFVIFFSMVEEGEGV